ncbi:MAG: twin-arginine translocase TatA/TatE family subunit [Chloroflexota bacterium]
MGAISPLHLVLLLVVVLIIFGPGKLPEVGGAIGRGLREFRKAAEGLEDTIRSEATAAESPAPASPSQPPTDDTASTPG